MMTMMMIIIIIIIIIIFCWSNAVNVRYSFERSVILSTDCQPESYETCEPCASVPQCFVALQVRSSNLILHRTSYPGYSGKAGRNMCDFALDARRIRIYSQHSIMSCEQRTCSCIILSCSLVTAKRKRKYWARRENIFYSYDRPSDKFPRTFNLTEYTKLSETYEPDFAFRWVAVVKYRKSYRNKNNISKWPTVRISVDWVWIFRSLCHIVWEIWFPKFRHKLRVGWSRVSNPSP
jgi:hypothetical protein